MTGDLAGEGEPEEGTRAGDEVDVPATIFVSDPSAEAERVAQQLRASGFGVVDVPLSMLAARVAGRVVGRRAASCSIRAAYLDRSWTGSTCMWRCRR